MIACLIGLLFGTGITALGIHTLRVGAASRYWPRVSGKVSRVFIETLTADGHLDQYSAHLEYAYEFKGRRQYATRSMGPSNTIRASAEAHVRDYAEGQQIDVYVNPLRPKENTLKPGIDYSAITPVLIGVPAIVVSLWNLFA